ncbi:hypothetical protein B9Y60_10660 [Stenotrophomonas maltophilia]|uniref:hypothetical protein n=1 Tax=Stenotrophomonas maltophilia TaxID=40324 RepID=UPI000C269E63|nr:hypothetical protein [Stenotrophomonas maltophilia]PJL52214.1 hypothetical protein B9Y73_10660 [Stenotrophomonas maltophilia]PJL55135.1 hypothetical protein B9Y60_10660 [Stenotrophomonas maltophilia]
MVNGNQKNHFFSIGFFIGGLFMGVLLHLPIINGIAFFLLFMYLLAKLIDASRHVEKVNRYINENYPATRDIPMESMGRVMGRNKHRFIGLFTGIMAMTVFLHMNPTLNYSVLQWIAKAIH